MRRPVPAVFALLALTASLASLSQTAPSPGPYKVLKTVKVGGEGGFDYVTADPAGRRLYVARSGPAGHIDVFDLDTLAPAGSIPNVSAHGAVIDPHTGHGFATSKPITMFDAKSLAILKSIDTQGNPDGYLDDPAESKVYILSHRSPNVTILDAKDGAVLGMLDLGGAPEQSVLDGKGHLYIDLEDKNSIAVVDTKAMKVTSIWDLAGKGGGCAGLAIDLTSNVLFSSCREPRAMVMVDAATGKVIDALPIGAGTDNAFFNPKTMEAFSSNGDGTLTVIKENSKSSFVVEQTLTTLPRAKTMTLDPVTGHLYLIAAQFGPPPPADPANPTARPGRPSMLPGSFAIIVAGR